jgi:excisionase family DNA binding protein
VATMSTPLLTVADVCTRLSLGKSKIFELIARGELESLKIDSARRFTEQQVADFIERRADAGKVPA